MTQGPRSGRFAEPTGGARWSYLASSPMAGDRGHQIAADAAMQMEFVQGTGREVPFRWRLRPSPPAPQGTARVAGGSGCRAWFRGIGWRNEVGESFPDVGLVHGLPFHRHGAGHVTRYRLQMAPLALPRRQCAPVLNASFQSIVFVVDLQYRVCNGYSRRSLIGGAQQGFELGQGEWAVLREQAQHAVGLARAGASA